MYRGSAGANRVPAGAAISGAAQVLSGLLLDRVGASVGDVVAWDSPGQELVALARRHKVAAMLTSAPTFHLLSDDTQALLVRERRRAVMRNMANLSRTVAMVEALANAGVPAVVLKGQAFSQFAYGDWSDRGVSVDIDLLVPGRELAAAHQTLVAHGFVCITDGVRRPPLHGRLGRYNRWLHYQRTYRSPTLGTVDLHWRLMPGSAEWTSFGAVWVRHIVLGIGGVALPVPGAAHAAVIAADQAEADGWSDLRCCVDVTLSWRSCDGEERHAARGMYPEIERVVAQATDRLQTIEVGQSASGKGAPRARARLWRARLRSGTLATAVARALCGQFAPARTFSRQM